MSTTFNVSFDITVLNNDLDNSQKYQTANLIRQYMNDLNFARKLRFDLQMVTRNEINLIFGFINIKETISQY